jgi:hypothetical protein
MCRVGGNVTQWEAKLKFHYQIGWSMSTNATYALFRVFLMPLASLPLRRYAASASAGLKSFRKHAQIN